MGRESDKKGMQVQSSCRSEIDLDLQKQVSEILSSDIPDRHSFFQLNFFVLGKEPTIQAKLKRCIDELRIRQEQWEAIELEVEELQDRIKLSKLKNLRSDFATEEEKIEDSIFERKIKSQEKQIFRLKKKLNNLKEEIVFFVEAFQKLVKQEPLKNWDDLEVQMEYWDAKIEREIKYKMLVGLPLDMELIKTAMSLPEQSKTKKYITGLLSKKNTGALQCQN